jgi:hypothetical protein
MFILTTVQAGKITLQKEEENNIKTLPIINSSKATNKSQQRCVADCPCV